MCMMHDSCVVAFVSFLFSDNDDILFFVIGRYCTGGIRCERATALLNQMVAASEDTSTPSADDTPKNGNKSELNNKNTTKNDIKPTSGSNQKPTESSGITCKPKGVFELRGGIERYVKTFPQGGFWKGKNYLFDRYVDFTWIF